MNQIRKREEEKREKIGGGEKEKEDEKWGIVLKSKSPFINNQL